jgi:C4-dicarboxylate-specific signal transduction histidine kinase
METSGAPTLDPAGNLTGYRGADADVTERKQLEMQIQQQRSELAHRARVSMIGQLASSLAHELNQPLGAILRNAEAGELLLQDPSPDLDELQAILADIRGEDQRAGHIIDRMRSMMKRREPERHRLNLDVLVDEVVALVQPDAERRRVRLVRETGAAMPPIQGDRIQLQQVLLNLLVNAMDALADNPPAASVVTLRTQLADRTVEVAVSDNGQGIPADSLLRVFEPFFTSKPDGLGMGLAISRGIIEAHGGRLGAENNTTGGATFAFVLPVVEGGDAK